MIDSGYPAYTCRTCGSTTPDWRITRHGDAVVTWACDRHLVDVLRQYRRHADEPAGTMYTVRPAKRHAA